jgi:hypothetical protein
MSQHRDGADTWCGQRPAAADPSGRARADESGANVATITITGIGITSMTREGQDDQPHTCDVRARAPLPIGACEEAPRDEDVMICQTQELPHA